MDGLCPAGVKLGVELTHLGGGVGVGGQLAVAAAAADHGLRPVDRI
ncbi:hypothetical protein ACIA49_35245 [Kribbella sp. NPDC051587]